MVHGLCAPLLPSEVSRPGGSSLNRFSALQTSPSTQGTPPPAHNVDFDSQRALGRYGPPPPHGGPSNRRNPLSGRSM